MKRVKDRDASSGRRTRLVVSELKTPKSRRTLTLTPELVSRSGNIGRGRLRRG